MTGIAGKLRAGEGADVDRRQHGVPCDREGGGQAAIAEAPGALDQAHGLTFEPDRLPRHRRLAADAERRIVVALAVFLSGGCPHGGDDAPQRAPDLHGAVGLAHADAVEQLRAKVVRLEERREEMKAANATYRREHKAELAAMTEDRDRQLNQAQLYKDETERRSQVQQRLVKENEQLIQRLQKVTHSNR